MKTDFTRVNTYSVFFPFQDKRTEKEYNYYITEELILINALISESAGSLKDIFVLDIPYIEDTIRCYTINRLYCV